MLERRLVVKVAAMEETEDDKTKIRWRNLPSLFLSLHAYITNTSFDSSDFSIPKKHSMNKKIDNAILWKDNDMYKVKQRKRISLSAQVKHAKHVLYPVFAANICTIVTGKLVWRCTCDTWKNVPRLRFAAAMHASWRFNSKGLKLLFQEREKKNRKKESNEFSKTSKRIQFLLEQQKNLFD